MVVTLPEVPKLESMGAEFHPVYYIFAVSCSPKLSGLQLCHYNTERGVLEGCYGRKTDLSLKTNLFLPPQTNWGAGTTPLLSHNHNWWAPPASEYRSPLGIFELSDVWGCRLMLQVCWLVCMVLKAVNLVSRLQGQQFINHSELAWVIGGGHHN